VAVCVPWRAGDPSRERNVAYVRRFWERLGWPVILGDTRHQTFNRSAARNMAARQSSADLLVFADADIIGEPAVILAAAVHALEHETAVWPHTVTHLLSRQDTKKVHDGADPAAFRGARLFKGSPAGILIVHRDLYETVGGWDDGFDGGWGFEDVAFAWTLRTLADTRRFDGRLTHLWHPTAPEKQSAIAYRTPNRARRDLYHQAIGDRQAMRQLLDSLT
jgi:predicted glycosyltransferase involved in capsule biosynthesis